MNNSTALNLQLLRNGTVLSDFGNATHGYVNAINHHFNLNLHYFDTPASTSALVYKTQFRSTYGGTNTVAVNTDNTTSYITLMEIAQ